LDQVKWNKGSVRYSHPLYALKCAVAREVARGGGSEFRAFFEERQGQFGRSFNADLHKERVSMKIPV
jgi:hypothetical protein